MIYLILAFQIALVVLIIVQGILLSRRQDRQKARIQELGVELSEEVQRIYTAINEQSTLIERHRQLALRRYQDHSKLISDLLDRTSKLQAGRR